MISSDSSTGDDQTAKDKSINEWQKSRYKSFETQCKEAVPSTIKDESKSMLFMIGGMSHLLSDLTTKDKLSVFDTKLLKQVLEKEETRDESLLGKQIRIAFEQK